MGYHCLPVNWPWHGTAVDLIDLVMSVKSIVYKGVVLGAVSDIEKLHCALTALIFEDDQKE